MIYWNTPCPVAILSHGTRLLPSLSSPCSWQEPPHQSTTASVPQHRYSGYWTQLPSENLHRLQDACKVSIKDQKEIQGQDQHCSLPPGCAYLNRHLPFKGFNPFPLLARKRVRTNLRTILYLAQQTWVHLVIYYFFLGLLTSFDK